jgi:hypothetical protein
MKPGSFHGTYAEFDQRLHPDDRELLQHAVRIASGDVTECNFELGDLTQRAQSGNADSDLYRSTVFSAISAFSA